ncbi:UPF0287-domain-containing protein [Thelephora ganbajun]|uniref:UPF0287-domain-containing protein n=1 Tax=Thelephora ganbajun TaxID=370292 RepID=A0ACB6YZY1_THEGA|nr:UPF0287-domain-containing protein [Thelephora ganbajun]
MHPQESERFVVCKEFFQALEACHADNWRKWTGGCNNVKTELNMCLRKVRLEASARNREHAKERRKKIENAWKELHHDD